MRIYIYIYIFKVTKRKLIIQTQESAKSKVDDITVSDLIENRLQISKLYCSGVCLFVCFYTAHSILPHMAL